MTDTAAFADQEEKIRVANKHHGMSPGDKEGHWIDDLGETKRNAHVNRLVTRMRKDVVAINQESVNRHMVAVRQAKHQIGLMKELWEDPVDVLMRSTLYSERRATLTANLQHAGPGELIKTAKVALMRNDKDLASAICVRIDALPKKSRDMVAEHLAKRDLAERLMHDELTTARAHILLAEAHAAEADIAGREALNMRVQSSEKIGLGVRKEQIERELGVSLDELLAADEKPASTPPVTMKIEDTASPETKKFYEKEAGWREWNEAYAAGEYDRAEAIAKKHDFDIYDDEEESAA